MTACAFELCGHEARRRALCGAHYEQLKRGIPLRPVRFRAAGPVLPFADLETFLARGVVDDGLRHNHGSPRLLTDTYIANALGTYRHAVLRWRRNGLRVWRCEVIADHLGEHPAAIWPGYVDAVLEAPARHIQPADTTRRLKAVS